MLYPAARMHRLLPALMLLVAGCTGSLDSSGSSGGPGGPDAGHVLGGGGGSGSGSGTHVTVDAASTTPTCRNAVTTNLGNGHHNPGQDCESSCHNHGFSVSGTLYTSGGAAASGATVTIVDGGGTVTDMVVQSNGNFYSLASVLFPYSIYVSDCPTLSEMTETVSQDVGCNSSACHGGSQGKIHL